MFQVSVLYAGVISLVTIAATSVSEAACLTVRAMPEVIVIGYPQQIGA